jgi:hypothetical protein
MDESPCRPFVSRNAGRQALAPMEYESNLPFSQNFPNLGQLGVMVDDARQAGQSTRAD